MTKLNSDDLTIIIAFGSNLSGTYSNSASLLKHTFNALQGIGLIFTHRSSLWTSPSWPDPTKPKYVNAVALYKLDNHYDDGGPQGLLSRLLALEAQFGRDRSTPNAPRTLDLDLISFKGLVLDVKTEPPLILPHPRFRDRAFVLKPLAEIAPKWTDPVTGRTAQDLLNDLPNTEKDAVQRHFGG